jgi:PHS family inorganic phosphate transporter-like MFS transporter
VLCSLANYSTAYNLQSISLPILFLKSLGHKPTTAEESAVSTAALAGCIFGQLLFGFLGDLLGRQLALTLTILTTVIGAVLTTLSWDITGDKSSIFIILAVFRFILGMGVGGVYPLAAVIAGEASSEEEDEDEGTYDALADVDANITADAVSNNATGGVDKKAYVRMSLVFSTQGLGLVSPPLLAAILLWANVPEDVCWRLILAVGALPGIVVFILSFFVGSSICETPKICKKKDAGDLTSAFIDTPEAAASPSCMTATITRVKTIFKPSNLIMLIGTAGSWALFDFCFYGNNLFKSEVMELIFPADKNTTGMSPTELAANTHSEHLQEVYKDLFCAIIALPGYYIATLLMGRLGLKFIQEQGFFLMSFLFLVLAIAVNYMKPVGGGALVVIVYGLTFFSSNFGPNTVTFLLPAATFPTVGRSTLNGISAASGKIGATIGSSCFKPLLKAFQKISKDKWGTDEHGVQFVFLICAVVAFLGGVLTVFFVKGSPLPNKKDLLARPCAKQSGQETNEMDSPVTNNSVHEYS